MNDQNKTSTYGDNDSNNTGLYGQSELQKTGTYSTEGEKTSAYSEYQPKVAKSSTHGIGVSDTVILKDKTYTVSGILSEGTGEAVIYKITDANHNTFVWKLYFEFNNIKEEPNFETLKRLCEISDPDILRLHDFGVGADKYQGKYCYEISDLAEGGDLFNVSDFKSKYTPQFIEQHIVPEIFNGIATLHKYIIFHCDLKPSNLFFKDKDQLDLLIGDYGSAKSYDLETEKEARKSSTVKGTDTYLAPEQARGIITSKNDYYSLGMVILHLLYPEQLAKDSNYRQIDKKKFERIAERQYNGLPIIDFDPRHKRLNNLIEGLTLFYHINRFGRAEVDRWLEGEEVPVQYRTEGTGIQPIKLGHVTIRNESDFIAFIEKHESWYEDLIEESDTYATVKNWMDSYRDVPSRKVFDSMIKFYQPLGKNYVKESLLRFFEPTRDIKIDMTIFNFFGSVNLMEEVDAYIRKLDEIWKFTSLDKIRFYVFQLEFCLRQLKTSVRKDSEMVVSTIIDKIYTAFSLVQKPFDNYKTDIQAKISLNDKLASYRLLLNLFYRFNPERTFKDGQNSSISSLDELGIFYVQQKEAYTDEFLVVEREFALQRWNKSNLHLLDHKNFLFEVFKDKAETEVELVDLTFNKHREYLISYKYFKSLNRFFATKRIEIDFTNRSNVGIRYQSKRGFFKSFQSEFQKFISVVCERHTITTLTPENINSLQKRFLRDSWRRYIYVNSGQFFAFIIILPLIWFFYKIASNQLHFDNNWKPYFMEAETFKQKIKNEKIAALFSIATIKSARLYSNMNKSEDKYKNSFLRKDGKSLQMDLFIVHGEFSRQVNFVVKLSIYRGMEKLDEWVFNCYSNPERNDISYTLLFPKKNSDFWRKGNYRIDVNVENILSDQVNFKIKDNGTYPLKRLDMQKKIKL